MHLMYGVCHELQLLQKHGADCSLSLKIAHYKKRKRKKGKVGGGEGGGVRGGVSLLSLPLIVKHLVYLLLIFH